MRKCRLEHLTLTRNAGVKRKTANQKPKVLFEIDSRIWASRYSKVTNITESYKGFEVVNSHGHPCTEGTHHTNQK